ncbi:MAG: transcriptional repressor [Acidobacteriia bacterium]|nr:transcriptional repressor [Terriglobia bacterium]
MPDHRSLLQESTLRGVRITRLDAATLLALARKRDSQVNRVHLACFECGRIEEFASPLFERRKAEISPQKGFHIRVTRLEVAWRCSKCCAAASCQGCSEENCGKRERAGN